MVSPLVAASRSIKTRNLALVDHRFVERALAFGGPVLGPQGHQQTHALFDGQATSRRLGQGGAGLADARRA
jgi:hypothetical protein